MNSGYSREKALALTLAISTLLVLGVGVLAARKLNTGCIGWVVLATFVCTALLCFAMLGLLKNISSSKTRKKDEAFEQSRLKALITLSAMTDAPLKEIVNFTLDEAIRLTKSEVGYLAFVEDDQTTLVMQAWSKGAMKQCAMQEKPIVYKISETGLWGEAFRQKKPIITNDYSAPNPAKKGYPEGHVPIKRHFNLPVMEAENVVAIAGVGNKKEPYNETDVRQFTLLMEGMWRLVKEHQNKVLLEKELHESERKFSTLMNNLPGMAYRCRNNRDWTMEFVSKGCLDLTGYKDDEIIGNKVVAYNSLIHPDEQAMVWDEVQTAISKKQPFLLVYRVITKSGQEKWVWEKGQGIFSQNGELTAIEGFVTSISERIQALQELRSLQNLFSNIVNSMPSILVAVDENGLVTQWNLEAEKATGVAAAYVEGRFLEEVLPRMAGRMNMVWEAISSNSPVKQTKVPGGGPESKEFYDYTVFPLVFEDSKGAVIRIDEVTERARIEEMMIQSEKMLTLGGLAAGMAHEVNNPLAGIIQNIQVITHRLTWNSKKNLQQAEESGLTMEALQSYLQEREILKMLNLVSEAGDRASSIVENMLDFSRTNGLAENQDIHLDSLLDKTMDIANNDISLQRHSNITNIVFKKEYEPNLPTVYGEPGKIQQVLLNLIKNAAQAMEKNAEEGRDSEIRLRLSDEEKFVRIELEDTGPGIPADLRAKIFEPFFTTKARGIGTGLGLSVSNFIITQVHQGTMEVQSPPGKGARFIIRLPKHRPADEENQP